MKENYCIIRKQTGNRKAAWEKMTLLSYVFEFAPVSGDDILSALKSRMTDFEDAVIASSAARHSAAYIVTRNTDDFRFSSGPVITPEKFNRSFILRRCELEAALSWPIPAKCIFSHGGKETVSALS